MQTPYAGEAGILLHIFGKFMILMINDAFSHSENV
jgi:hypothetical protein